MRRHSIRIAAVMGLCALGAGAGPAVAQTVSSGVSVTTSGSQSAAGYFVGPDGVIEYRPAGQAAPPPPSLTAPAPAPMAVDDDYQSMAADTPVYMAPAVPASVIPAATLADAVYEAPLQDAVIGVGAGMTPIYSDYETAPVLETEAPMIYEAPAPSEIAAPVIYDAAPDMQVFEEIRPTGTAMTEVVVYEDIPAEETVVVTDYIEEMAAPAAIHGATVAESYVTESYVTESYVVEPDPAPVYPVVTETVFVEPTPLPVAYDFADEYGQVGATVMPMGGYASPPPGRVLAAMGDGAYGPSKIDIGIGGPGSQRTDVYLSKSAMVTLPVEAREVIVSDQTMARAILRTARQMVLTGLRLGQTNAFFFDERGKKILSLEINVTHDLGPLREALARNFPGVDIQVESVLGEVIAIGVVDSPSEAAQIRTLIKRFLNAALNAAGYELGPNFVPPFVDRITTQIEDQVMLKVRVAEMRRSLVRQFGIDLSAAKGAIDSLGLSSVSNVLNMGRLINSFGVNNAQLGGVIGNFAGEVDDYSFGALIKAFERHNVMRVLAEPTLTAVTGETASFLAGGQFPYPVSIEDGEIGYDFRDFGVALEFTPVVIGDGRISLRVSTEVSELTNEGALGLAGGISIPGISVRRASTVVEIPSGGTMSIAGMLLQRDAGSHSGLPGLKNLPVLGQLFSSSDYSKSETELVILVTPYVVKPGEEKDFRVPTDGFAPSSDIDFYLLGRLQKIYGAGDSETVAARKAIKAPLGFIID